MHVKYLVQNQAPTNYSINGIYDDEEDGVDDVNNGESEKEF